MKLYALMIVIFFQIGLFLPICQAESSFVHSKISKEKFDFIIDKVKKIYTPIIERLGYKFMIEGDWLSTRTNAYSNQKYDTKYIRLFGGYARKLGPGVFLQVVCHEVGHHLGGFPYKSFIGGASIINVSWSPTEGQADYFASLYCVRKVLADDTNRVIDVGGLELLPEKVKKDCKQQFKKPLDFEICLKNIKISLDAHKFRLHHSGENDSQTNGVGSTLKFSNEVVDVTRQDHASSLCRLTTSYQASLCNFEGLQQNDFISFDNEFAGVCHEKHGDKIGARPKCWFKSEFQPLVF